MSWMSGSPRIPACPRRGQRSPGRGPERGQTRSPHDPCAGLGAPGQQAGGRASQLLRLGLAADQDQNASLNYAPLGSALQSLAYAQLKKITVSGTPVAWELSVAQRPGGGRRDHPPGLARQQRLPPTARTRPLRRHGVPLGGDRGGRAARGRPGRDGRVPGRPVAPGAAPLRAAQLPGSDRWAPSDATTHSMHPNPYGIVQFIYGTVLTSVIGMLIAVPMSVGIGLFITGIAPAWLRRPCHTWRTCSRRSHRWCSGSEGSSRSSRSCSRPRAS
jgi:hypothetical protein